MILAEVSDGVFPGTKSPTEGFDRAVFNLGLRVYSSPLPPLGVGSGVTGVSSVCDYYGILAGNGGIWAENSLMG